MDELDRDLSRLLKNWAAEVPPPSDGRNRLLRAAKLVPYEQTLRFNMEWLLPLIEQVNRPRDVEKYYLPKDQAVHWYFHLAVNSRITD